MPASAIGATGDSMFGEAMMKKLVASLAVATLVVAQPLAAATRSSESLPSHGVSAPAAERTGSITDPAEDLKGNPIIVIGLIAVILAGLLLLAGNSDSPG